MEKLLLTAEMILEIHNRFNVMKWTYIIRYTGIAEWTAMSTIFFSTNTNTISLVTTQVVEGEVENIL
jgi:hypothetical protein